MGDADKPPGYRQLARHELYSNRWIRLEAHDIVHPNGQPGEHAVVIPPPAAAVVALEGDDVILTRQPRYAIGRTVLEVVKGGADAGETPLQAAQRELREEVGVVAARWDALGIGYEIPSIVQEPVCLFLARDITRQPAKPEDVESIEAVRMPFYAALKAVAHGEIDDAMTALALFRAACLLESEE